MSPDTPSKPDPQAQNSKPEWWLVRVPDDADDSRFDRFLRRLVPGLPQGDIERMLRSGLIRLDGVKAKPATRLASGQEVRLPPHLHTVQKSSKKPPANKGGRDAAAPRRDKELVSQFESMIIAEGSDWLALNSRLVLRFRGEPAQGTILMGCSWHWRQMTLRHGCGLYIELTRTHQAF